MRRPIMSDALPLAEIVHSMKGRARLRLAAHRGDEKFFTTLAAGLSAHPGVTKVEVAPLTGSVLVQHFGSFEEIVTAAEKAGLFQIGVPEEPAAPAAPIEWPRLPVDPKLALAVGLGLAAIWQLGKGKALPPAITLLWYATRLGGLGGTAGSLDDAE